MKKLSLLAFLFVLNTNAWSQTGTDRKTYTKEELLAAEQAYYQSLAVRTVATPVVSEYSGFEEKIKEICLKGAIPDTFPKAKQGASKEEYVLEMNTWISNNPLYLRPEFTNYKFNANTN